MIFLDIFILLKQSLMFGEADQDGNMEKGLTKQLLLAQEETEHDDEDDCDGSEESAEDSRKPANSFVAAYKLLTPSVKVKKHQSLVKILIFFTRVVKHDNFIVLLFRFNC